MLNSIHTMAIKSARYEEAVKELETEIRKGTPLVFMSGEPGCGKSHALKSMRQLLHDQGYSVCEDTVDNMHDRVNVGCCGLRGSWSGTASLLDLPKRCVLMYGLNDNSDHRGKNFMNRLCNMPETLYKAELLVKFTTFALIEM